MAQANLDTLKVRDQFWHRKTDTTHPFHNMPRMAVDGIARVTGYQYYSDDFIHYVGPNTAGESGGWILTETAAGAGNAQRVDVDNSQQFGKLLLLTDNGDNDLENLQMTGEPWRYVSGKRLWFFCEYELSDANDGECFLGLALEDTSLIAGVTDGIYFDKAETATVLDFKVTKNSTTTTNTITGTIADATARIAGFYVDSSGDIHAYEGAASGGIDGIAEVATVQSSQANIPDDEDLMISLSIQTGTTAANSMSLDWLFACQER